VKLENAFNETATVEQNDTFGLIDILSGRLRDATATAETNALALGIDGEDFFDLLSNNVDIVKGLFRHLLDDTRKPVAW
jgi:CRP-like cAMP-binding protein